MSSDTHCKLQMLLLSGGATNKLSRTKIFGESYFNSRISFNFNLRGSIMEIKTGYLYHIKDDFFDKVKNKELMINHKNGHSGPTYFTISYC